MRPRVAVTLGDPRGIGPEVVHKALADPAVPAEYVVIGPEALLDAIPAAHRIAVATDPSTPSPLTPHPSPFTHHPSPFTHHASPFTHHASPFTLDVPPRLAGLMAVRAVEEAVRLALAGDVAAVVTAPAEKAALHVAGYRYAGHTELLAALAGEPQVAMMLVAGGLRVVLVTTHMALRDVPAALTAERVVAVGRITERALRERWGVAAPRLAVCALNPHAGEGGLFGDEEARVLEPAARALGAAGPLPADTVFVRAMRGEFDAVLAPYHDVGMTAVKVAGFGTGVNVTLGLPFIRTAPDHGTALDIAGQGVADAGSMREAIRLAVELVQRAR